MNAINYHKSDWREIDGIYKIIGLAQKKFQTNLLRRFITERRNRSPFYLESVQIEKLPNGGAFLYIVDNYGTLWLDLWASWTVALDYYSRRARWCKGVEVRLVDTHLSDERGEVSARPSVEANFHRWLLWLEKREQVRDLNHSHWPDKEVVYVRPIVTHGTISGRIYLDKSNIEEL